MVLWQSEQHKAWSTYQTEWPEIWHNSASQETCLRNAGHKVGELSWCKHHHQQLLLWLEMESEHCCYNCSINKALWITCIININEICYKTLGWIRSYNTGNEMNKFWKLHSWCWLITTWLDPLKHFQVKCFQN